MLATRTDADTLEVTNNLTKRSVPQSTVSQTLGTSESPKWFVKTQIAGHHSQSSRFQGPG